jgi:hypothetical protein
MGLQEGDSEDGKELDRIDNERARQWFLGFLILLLGLRVQIHKCGVTCV